MRAIFAAIFMVSASIAVIHPAQARNLGETPPGYPYGQAPVGHRQPTRDDVKGPGHDEVDAKSIDKDNELLEQPPSPDAVTGADQVQSEENALAKTIEHENDRLDHLLRDICRGC